MPSAPNPSLPSRNSGGLARRLRRFWRRLRPGSPPLLQSNLPELIGVFAAFTRMDGIIDEDEVDSILGFLRYDYPESVYAGLRQLYIEALREEQDLDAMADDLAPRLNLEEKILLGIQLYVLVFRAGVSREAMETFIRFMTGLGVAREAVELVYQLNVDSAHAPPEEERDQESPLEALTIGGRPECDVAFPQMPSGFELAAFRLRHFLLLKNNGNSPVVVRGHHVPPGGFSRLYEGQNVVLDDIVLHWQDLHSCFNARRNLPGDKLFLRVQRDNHVLVERKRSRHSLLELEFGIDASVRALEETRITLNGKPLEKGRIARAGFRDSLVLPGGLLLSLSELRRRARDMGGRFEVTPGRSKILVSNNPALLGPGDLLVSPDLPGDLLLRLRLPGSGRGGSLDVLESPRPILVAGRPAQPGMPLADGESITLADGHFLRCHFSDGILEEDRALVTRLQAREISHAFTRRESALESVSFEARRGEMICIMGPSGCGKSTLLRVLAGQLQPQQGSVRINGIDLHAESQRLRPFISFMPHEEGFDPLLSVRANLDTAAAIRAPHYTSDERRRRIEAKLGELGLAHRAAGIPGTSSSRLLSHGERKRLNIGLDLIGISGIHLFDEPTSGLSSKDSEHILEIIGSIAQNKIIVVSIHQPSARLLRCFHKVLLLDHQGCQAFYGAPAEMFDYFNQAYLEENVRLPRHPRPGSVPESDRRQPEFVFDVLETPLLDPGGEVLEEEDHRGRLRASRRFSPAFWRDRFQAHRLLNEVHQPTITAGSEQSHTTALPRPPAGGPAEEWLQLRTHFKRSLLAKLRNRANLFTTLVEAPALALLVSLVMRYSEDAPYTFGNAFHIPTYLFLSLVVAMFLGLTNSAEEIIRDRAMIRRERNHNPRHSFHVLAKTGSLSLFSAVQCLLYLWVGNTVLGISSMTAIHFIWLFLANLSGVVTGLFISALAKDAKTALNIIPLVLIPQIILGGALIKYEEMNRDLDFLSAFTRWHQADAEPPSSLEVPFICEFMPLRWAYEGIVISQARLNPLSRAVDAVDSEIEPLKNIPPGQATPSQEERLAALKDARFELMTFAAPDRREVVLRIRRFRRDLANEGDPSGVLAIESVEEAPADGWIRARDLFWNEKTRLLHQKAEIERTDIRRQVMPNVFFGNTKRVFNREWDTIQLNLHVLVGFILTGAGACVFLVRRLANKA